MPPPLKKNICTYARSNRLFAAGKTKVSRACPPAKPNRKNWRTASVPQASKPLPKITISPGPAFRRSIRVIFAESMTAHRVGQRPDQKEADDQSEANDPKQHNQYCPDKHPIAPAA